MKSNIKIQIIILMAITFTLVSCNPTTVNINTTPNPRNNYLMFASNRSGVQQYYLYHEGVITHLAINLPGVISMSRPQWLQDQRKWLFSAETSTDSEIYLFEESGDKFTNLTNTPDRYDADPVFSPDGKTMVYVAVDRDLDIFVMDLQNFETKNLTQYPSRDKSPIWLDNEWILFSSNQNGTPNIYKMRKDGTELTDLTNGSGMDGVFDLSPGKDTFIFESDRDGSLDLFLYNFTDGVINNITNNPAKDYSPLWSPNGKMIAFLSDREGGEDIYIYETETQKAWNLTKTPTETKIGVSWSPSSDRLSFVTDSNGNLEVFSITINGEVMNISNNPADDFSAGWLVK